ncbi:MAG: GNAT family N-acetyltransferase [Candidatus Eremiobacteraeota bacterium]|nr:GNAT family N-acetyltransferase [Candidatus Eremiobacteraeota bacterium]
MAPVIFSLKAIATDDYVREVLPESYELWGAKRTFERYAADLRVFANSSYAKRRQFLRGLRIGGAVVVSCKSYARELRWQAMPLRATGIGAVFTPPAQRGRGYATALLGTVLDAERAAGRDVAFLYSDIHPLFYERLGFRALPSRLMTMRAELLDGARVGAQPLTSDDWPAVGRCFEALDRARPWSLRRTPLVWEWMRRCWHEPADDGSQPVELVIRNGRAVSAYAIGRRVLREDTFVVDDFAFDGAHGRERLHGLLRAAAGDLRRVGGWLPPPGAREALPRGSIRARKDAIMMVVPISPLGRAWWEQTHEVTLSSSADPGWSADHV